MESTPLSTIIARMQRWTAIFRNPEEKFLVYDIDEALRNLRRQHQTPWTLQKSTVRVFDNVLEYPTASDHLSLAFIEGQQESYEGKPRPYYTSIQEFYADPNNLSQLAEIWKSGSLFLGIRNKKLSNTTQSVDTCELDSGYTLTGDFTAGDVDNVVYKTGNGSMRLTLVSSTALATVEKTFTGFSANLYKRKYAFFNVYLTSVPTSITIKFGVDSSNYLQKVVTTQFAGQAFVADDWNTIAIDLNEPDSTVGTVAETSTFAYYSLTLAAAESGYYYLDEVSVREWELMDYWYYSKYVVKTSAGSVASKSAFLDIDDAYDPSDELVCPEAFADVIMYDAMLTTVSDVENSKVLETILSRRQKAWDALLQKYPSMEPIIITHGWRFGSQMGNVVKCYE